MELYQQKMTDAEIGRKLHVARQCVFIYRKELGLPHNYKITYADKLSAEEREVFECMMKGITDNQDIAKKLGITYNTTKQRVSRIIKKSGKNNRLDAFSWCMRREQEEWK